MYGETLVTQFRARSLVMLNSLDFSVWNLAMQVELLGTGFHGGAPHVVVGLQGFIGVERAEGRHSHGHVELVGFLSASRKCSADNLNDCPSLGDNRLCSP